MTQATSGRRGQGEDSIYWDASKNRYIGAVSLGFSPSGTRLRKKVTGRTKTEVRDKLRDLHKQGDIRDVQCVAHPLARKPAVHLGDVFEDLAVQLRPGPCGRRRSAQAGRRL